MHLVGTMIVATGFFSCLVYWIIVLYRVDQVEREIRNVTLTPVQTNDDECTKVKFAEILGEANSSMDIFDDGDIVDGSIYMDNKITDLVRRKLDGNRNFRIRCLFNVNEPELAFRNALSEYRYRSQVDIRIRNPISPTIPIHYKIIDGGTKAYLSRHRPDSNARRSRIVDCTNVSDSNRNRVSDVILGTYKEDFRRAFKDAKAVSYVN